MTKYGRNTDGVKEKVWNTLSSILLNRVNSASFPFTPEGE